MSSDPKSDTGNPILANFKSRMAELRRKQNAIVAEVAETVRQKKLVSVRDSLSKHRNV